MTNTIPEYWGDFATKPGVTHSWGGAWGFYPFNGCAFSIGLDLGQARDRSALVVVEHVGVLPPSYTLARFWDEANRGDPLPPAVREYRVRHLQRWEIGTPYDSIVADVATITRAPELAGARFVFDRSGVGRAVGDMLTVAFQGGALGSSWPMGVTMVGQGGGGDTASKRDLLGQLQLALQQGRFKIPRGIALGEVLEREFASFRMRISRSGTDTYDVARRAGEGHGDLVIAAALAVWTQPDWGVRLNPVENTTETPTAAYDEERNQQ